MNADQHVDVVAPGRIPMERILGREIGTVIRRLHEEHGVQFHLPGKVRSLSDHQVVLESMRRSMQTWSSWVSA